MKRRWISLLLVALLFALLATASTIAETNDEIDLAIDYGEMDINTEPGDLDIPDSVELDLETTNILNDGIVLEGNLDIDEPLHTNSQVSSNSFTDGNYDHDAFEIDKNGKLVKYRGSGGDVVIPNGVTSIGWGAFEWCDSITSVTIPKSVTSISKDAFQGCEKLTSISIPSSVTNIGERAFAQCYNLSNVTISEGVTSIGKEAFVLCHMVNITIPSTVTRIEGGAFFNCKYLSNVTILAERIEIKKYSTYYNEDEDETYYYYTFGKCSKNLIFHIIPSSDAIRWAKENNYDYDIIKQHGLSEKTLKLKSEQTHKLTVYGYKNSDITWSSSDTSIATVDNGKVTAKKVGKCVINAKHRSGETLKCKVTVYDPAELNNTNLSLYLGDTYKLKVTGLLNRKVTWSSSNTAVATVENSKIIPKKVGKCVISAKLSKGKYLESTTLKCKLTVTDSAKLSKTSLSLIVGKTSTLTVSGLRGRKVTWSSSNEKVATVNRGKVKAVGTGKCNITATIEDTKLSCAVTVTKPLTGDIHSILGENMNSINRRLPDKLRYFDDDAYTNDYFLVQTDDDTIISIALLTDADTGIGKYTLYGLYPGMSYDKACKLLSNHGWELDSESYDKSYFYNPKDSDVSFYVTIIDDEIDLIVYMYV